MGDDDDRSASAFTNERRARETETCEHCGASIDTSDWYPVSKQRDADGSLELLSFCDEDCQSAWQDDHTSDD